MQSPRNSLGQFVKGYSHNKGRQLTAETRTRLSRAHLGKTPWNKGLKATPEAIEKNRLAKLGHKQSPATIAKRIKRGADHYNWKGGTSREGQGFRKTPEYAAWRKEVLNRDNYTCQACGKRGGHDLQVDHELPYILFPALRTEVLNGRTFCAPCHRKTQASNHPRTLRKLHLFPDDYQPDGVLSASTVSCK